MAVIGYARVSTLGQDNGLEAQKTILEEAGATKIFFEKITGTSTEQRKQLKDCLDYLRKDDTLVVSKIDRLARSISDLSNLMGELRNKGVNVIFLKDNMEFKADEKAKGLSSLMFNILGSFAQFERDLIVERTTAGRERAKAQGKHMGRKASHSPKDMKRALAQYEEREVNGMTVSDILKSNGIAKSTFYLKNKKIHEEVFEEIGEEHDK